MKKDSEPIGYLPLREEFDDPQLGYMEKRQDISFQVGIPHSEKLTRKQIALDTLLHYSGTDSSAFQKCILLTNFPHYVKCFAKLFNVKVSPGPVLRVAHCPAEELSIIDYRVSAPMAALWMDVLSYTKPQLQSVIESLQRLKSMAKTEKINFRRFHFVEAK